MSARILRAIGKPPASVYPPSEDSFLILQTLSKFVLRGSEVCDLGTGSGILGLFCASKGAKVTVTDINELALLVQSGAETKSGLMLGAATVALR